MRCRFASTQLFRLIGGRTAAAAPVPGDFGLEAVRFAMTHRISVLRQRQPVKAARKMIGPSGSENAYFIVHASPLQQSDENLQPLPSILGHHRSPGACELRRAGGTAIWWLF